MTRGDRAVQMLVRPRRTDAQNGDTMQIMDENMNEPPSLAENSMMSDHTDGPRDERAPLTGEHAPMGAFDSTNDGVPGSGSTEAADEDDEAGTTLGEDDSSFGGAVGDGNLPG